MKFKHGFYDIFVKTCAKYPSKIAVRIYDDESYSCYTYSELYGVCEYIAQNLQQLNCNRGLIGLLSKTNLIVPCVVAAAHKCCASFMFIDSSQNIEAVQEEMKFTVLISIAKDDEKVEQTMLSRQPDVTINVFRMCICFYSFGDIHLMSDYKYSPDLSFLALSSGSTGEPKKIQVPVQCIQPNITDLSAIFHITPDDVIYFSTPLTFDPAMIELLLAFMNGSSLLIAPAKVDILFPDNKQHSVTVWQTTPSKFFQLSNSHIKNKILTENTTLKILALGGEPLNGVRRLKELKHFDNKTKIFTLYGVTEMSCWACVAELDLARINNDREVPLGKCLSETKVIVHPEPTVKRSSGNILLGSSTRKCYVLNKANAGEDLNSLKFVDTGDLAEVASNGTIYYRGRRDDIVKRFGHKVNLQMIECAIMQCPKIKTCSAVWLPRPKLLVVYFSSEVFSSQDLSDFLKCKLDDKHWPDRIIRVNNLPTTSHGKISKSLVAKIFRKTENKPVSINSLKVRFLEELKRILNCNVTYDDVKNKDFFQIGGTSFLAVAMCNNIAYTHPHFGKFLLPLLINQSKSIDQIIELAEKEICVKKENKEKPAKRLKVNNPEQEEAPSTSEMSFNKSAALATLKSSPTSPMTEIQFIEIWTHNTGKCVDASPTLLLHGVNLYITVGSHSGVVVVLDAINGFVVGEITVGSRVEASVYCYAGDPAIPPCGIVGSYNGTIVCFTLETCQELWRQSIRTIIKSKATCCNGLAYVAAYDGHIRSFDLLSGQPKENILIAELAISADLILAKNEYIMIGTLAGSVAGFHVTTGSIIWRGTHESPIFANPALYDEERYVIFAEVSGEIHCRTVEKGLKVWSFTGAKGNIFSSIFIRPVSKLKFQMVFGCHDKCIYSIYVKNFQPSLHWKVPLSSPVYSTPCGINDNLVLASSNDGKLSVISAEYGLVIAEYTLPSETFSSPAVYEEYIFTGCRNDLIYCLRCIWNL